MKAVNPAFTSGFVLADDEGQPFWFLNTLTITKVGSEESQGQLSIVDHRMPAGFAPPPAHPPGRRRSAPRPGRRIRGILRGPGVAGRARLAGLPATRNSARLHRL